MAQVTVSRGTSIAGVNYTSGSAVTSGDVIVSGDVCLIATDDIAANRLGSVSMGGLVVRATVSGAYSFGAKVWWDDTNNKVTTSSSGNKIFGFMAEASAANNDVKEVLHWPIA